MKRLVLTSLAVATFVATCFRAGYEIVALSGEVKGLRMSEAGLARRVTHLDACVRNLAPPSMDQPRSRGSWTLDPLL